MKLQISDLKAWELGRVRKKPKKGEGKYYGRSGDHLTAYEGEFHRRNGEHPNPIESKTDETAVVVSRHGKPHGRHPLLNAVIQPTITYSQVRSSSTSASTTNPTRARRSRSREEDDAYFRCLNIFRQECAEHDSKVRALEEYRVTQMENVYSALQNGTPVPPMGPPPPNPEPYPQLITIEEFLARGTGTPGSHGSNVDGGSSTPASRSPVTTLRLGGGRAPSPSTRGSPPP